MNTTALLIGLCPVIGWGLFPTVAAKMGGRPVNQILGTTLGTFVFALIFSFATKTALPEGKDRRAHGHRRKGGRGAEAMERFLQLAGFSRGRTPVGQALCRWRYVHGRDDSWAYHVLARAYAGLDHLCDRRRRICPRYAIPA